MHASLQGALQQTPWEQKPEMHWVAELHSAPFMALPQEPFSHLLGGTQSESLLQLFGQVFPLHR
jgi:hypothetical protein